MASWPSETKPWLFPCLMSAWCHPHQPIEVGTWDEIQEHSSVPFHTGLAWSRMGWWAGRAISPLKMVMGFVLPTRRNGTTDVVQWVNINHETHYCSNVELWEHQFESRPYQTMCRTAVSGINMDHPLDLRLVEMFKPCFHHGSPTRPAKTNHNLDISGSNNL